MDTKVCPHCQRTLNILSFHPRSDRPGQVSSWCRACMRFNSKRYYDSQKGQERNQVYRQSDKRRESLAAYNVSDKRKAVQQKYTASGKPAAYQERAKLTDPDYQKKKLARGLAFSALRRGLIVRQKCEYANLENCHGRVEMHHDDYDKPLVIRWVCSRHHKTL